MQRTWATGSDHDRGPIEWVAAIDDGTNVAEHVRAALDVTVDATIAQCETGLLAVECVTYINGGDADLHPLVHAWIRDAHPVTDEALRTTALALLAKLRDSSALATYWRTELGDRYAAWLASLDHLRDRLTTAKRAPDPRTDPRIVAFAKSFARAKDHLRVALVPSEIVDEPIVRVLVAPGLSVVLHYADVGELEPLAVPLEHARGWKRSATELAELAAKRTREVIGLRTHILESAGFEINLAFGNSSFMAGLLPYASLLLADGNAPNGMLVAAPNAGTVVYHRIIDASWNEAAVEIIRQVGDLHAKATEKLSLKLWWWHEGEVIELPYTVISDTVIIEPVPAFMNCVDRLSS